MIDQGKGKFHDLRMQNRKRWTLRVSKMWRALTVKNFCFKPSLGISPFGAKFTY